MLELLRSCAAYAQHMQPPRDRRQPATTTLTDSRSLWTNEALTASFTSSGATPAERKLARPQLPATVRPARSSTASKLATASGAAALQQSGLMHQHTRPGRPARRKSNWRGCGFFAAATAVFFLVALCARGILLSKMPREGLYHSRLVEEEQKQEQRLYGLSLLPVFGAAIQGVNLSAPVAPDVVEQLKRDVLRSGRRGGSTPRLVFGAGQPGPHMPATPLKVLACLPGATGTGYFCSGTRASRSTGTKK
jgi:hypothetical protein